MTPHSPKARPSRPHTAHVRDDRDGALSALAARCSQTHRGLTSLSVYFKKCTTCAACLGLSFFKSELARTSKNVRKRGATRLYVGYGTNCHRLLTGVGHTTCRQSYMFLSIPIHETLPRGCTLTSQVFSTHDWYGKGAVYTEAEAPGSMAHVRFHKSQGIR